MLINLANPVNDHPLNDGLVAWWLPLKNTRGGSTLIDLVGGNHGTLTNGPAWDEGPNGFGAVEFASASSQAVRVSQQVTTVTDNVLMEALVRPTAFTTNATILNVGDGWTSALGYSISIGADNDASGQNLMLLLPGLAWVNLGSTAFPAANQWYHVVVGRTNGTWQGWVNGVSSGATNGTTPGTPAARLAIGSRWDGASNASNFFNGQIAYAAVRSVGPTQSIVEALYDQSLRGLPDTLRRLRPVAWYAGDVTPSPPPPPPAGAYVPLLAGVGW